MMLITLISNSIKYHHSMKFMALPLTFPFAQNHFKFSQPTIDFQHQQVIDSQHHSQQHLQSRSSLAQYMITVVKSHLSLDQFCLHCLIEYPQHSLHCFTNLD